MELTDKEKLDLIYDSLWRKKFVIEALKKGRKDFRNGEISAINSIQQMFNHYGIGEEEVN